MKEHLNSLERVVPLLEQSTLQVETVEQTGTELASLSEKLLMNSNQFKVS